MPSSETGSAKRNESLPLEIQVEHLRAAFEIEKAKIASRAQVVGATIGVCGAILVAAIGLFVNQHLNSGNPGSPSNTRTSPQINGKDITFTHEPVLSAELWVRPEWVRDDKWDQRCLDIGRQVLIDEGFRVFKVPSPSSTRGEAEGVQMGVRCMSDGGHALVFGLSSMADEKKLTAITYQVASKLRSQLNPEK